MEINQTDYSRIFYTNNTYFQVENVSCPEQEFIDFESTDELGNTIITFGLSRFDDSIQCVLSAVAEFFYANIRTSLYIYIATLEFLKLFSAEKGTFCTYESFKHSFLYQIYVHVIIQNPECMAFCRKNHLLGLDLSPVTKLDELTDMYEEKFSYCIENLRLYFSEN